MEEKAPSTKERLKSIVNDFDNFDSEMKIGTRVILIWPHNTIYNIF